MLYDNSVDFAPLQLLFRFKDGELVKQYAEINQWAMPIFNAQKK
jgi:hypothetical protein